MIPDRTPLERQLRDRIEELEEEVLQLKARLVPVEVFPLEWKLTPAGKRLLSLLYHTQGLVGFEIIFQTIMKYGEHDEIRNVVGSQICRLRGCLRDTGIIIKTHWSLGYSLAKESRPILKAILESEVAA